MWTISLFLVPLAFAQFQSPTPIFYPPVVDSRPPPLADASLTGRWDLDGFLGAKANKNGIKIGGGANFDTGVDFGLGIGQRRPNFGQDRINVPTNGLLGIGGRAEYGLGAQAAADLGADGLAAGIGAHEHKFIGLGATIGGK